MSLKDDWSDLQPIKRRPTSIKEKIQQWKKQRDNIISAVSDNSDNDLYSQKVECKLINLLCDNSTCFPLELTTLISKINTDSDDSQTIKNLLDKFSSQKLIELTESNKTFIINSVNYASLRENYSKLDTDSSDSPKNSLLQNLSKSDISDSNQKGQAKKRLLETDETGGSNSNEENKNSVERILSLQSAKEKENKKISEEILELLSKPTARELSLVEQFRSATGHVQEFCQYGTREECMRVNHVREPCSKLHFLKIIQKHTDESLGDCSFLNTCFHMDSCKYVHYKVEVKDPNVTGSNCKIENLTTNSNTIPLVNALATATEQPFKRVLFPPQWIRCDLRFFDMSVLGKFAVVMADPPWDIHMELPYGTMSDDEMRNLNIPCLQDEGLIFLWVTGRAMELGRDCLKLWGYERCDELIWVKTNQLQRIIRTGRTGHWINHGKEHCLVGVKGNPKNINRGLDCDVIVAEVRATSHKPDEIYGIIERLSPGTRKIELFGRQHNTQPNWVTLGNQLSNIKIVDPQLVDAYTTRYPEEVITDL